MKISRNELWRQKYRGNPYARHLSSRELEERFEDIFNLLITLGLDGRIGVGVGKDFNEEMWIKQTHVLEEMRYRYGPFPNGFTNGFIKKANFVQPTFPEIPKAKLAIDNSGGLVAGRLYKFSKKEYVEDMYRCGRFRVSPASMYSDPSLNSAIRDDELVFKGSFFPGLKGLVKAGKSPSPYGRIDYSVKARTNYYVACFASNYTYREFEDFGADACLVIKSPRRFIDRIMRAGNSVLEGYEGFAGAVRYLDPLVCDPSKIDVNFSKHFKYSYQNEYRVVWAPKDPIAELKAINIEIGSMEDIAEIVNI